MVKPRISETADQKTSKSKEKSINNGLRIEDFTNQRRARESAVELLQLADEARLAIKRDYCQRTKQLNNNTIIVCSSIFILYSDNEKQKEIVVATPVCVGHFIR